MKPGYINSPDRKRALIRQAKSRPCVDCLAEGKPGVWPWEAMTLDHTGPKRMDFAANGLTTRKKARSVNRFPSFLYFTATEIRAELLVCEPVCHSHHNMRTRRQMLARAGIAARREAESSGQLAIDELIPAPRTDSWYQILLKHSPRIWD